MTSKAPGLRASLCELIFQAYIPPIQWERQVRHCATCQHLFPDSLQVCPTDSVPLRLARELEPGMIIRGKYVVLGWIGAGGMAAVYRAKHRLLNEMRAVKVVASRFAGDEDFLKRFRHEAAIARRLRHENAVWVEDLDEIEDGRPFIAMEFLEGGDLRKLIKEQGPLTVERSLNVGVQVASALGAAHKLGIIHRDIKPDNIFITRDPAGSEVAKVLDFGIAKAKEGVLEGGYTATKTGVIIGTPEYMSPEQAEGQLGDKLDGRSDIYSLAVVLYEMMTGQLPFKSDTPLGMCLHHLQTVPRPPHELRPDLRIPETVSAILMKALEKKREKRFQSASEMLAALRSPEDWQKSLAPQTGVVAPTKISGEPTGQTNNAQPKAAVTQSTATGVSVQKAVTNPQTQREQVDANRPRSAPAEAADSIRGDAGEMDRGRKWRILAVATAVVICVAAGYLLVNAVQRRNAELRTHQSLLREQILEKFQSSAVLQGRGKGIAITVNANTVTLSGNVPLPQDREEAASEARQTPGVSDVVDNISVVEAPTAVAPPTPTRTAASGAANDPAPETQPPATLPEKQRPSTPSVTHPDNAAKVSDLVRSGNAALDQGNYAAAINDFQKAMQLDPRNSVARNGLQRARDAQKAEQDVLGTK